jgi:hypothetical protein
MADEVNNDTNTEVTASEVNWQERAEIAEKGLMKRDTKLKELEGEVKKLRNTVKVGPVNEDGQDYKSLYQQESTAKAKLIERTRKADVNTAATARLTKVGVTSDALEAAIHLIDASKVEWDEEAGVDETSVNAAVATLKTKFPVLFEKKVAATSVKVASDGKTVDAKTITRADFENLSHMERASKMAAGFKVV